MVGKERTADALAATQIEGLGEIRLVIAVRDDLLISSQMLKDMQSVVDYEARMVTVSHKQGRIT